MPSSCLTRKSCLHTLECFPSCKDKMTKGPNSPWPKLKRENTGKKKKCSFPPINTMSSVGRATSYRQNPAYLRRWGVICARDSSRWDVLSEILLGLLRLCWNNTSWVVETIFCMPVSAILGPGTAQKLSSWLYPWLFNILLPQLAHNEQGRSAYCTVPMVRALAYTNIGI